MYEELEESLDKIYAKIPDFSCRHCHKCCGPIMWFKPKDIVTNNYLKKQNIKKIIWTLDEFKKTI